MDVAIVLVAVSAAVGSLLAIRYWRPAVFCVFILVVLEGSLRKWIFPSAQAYVYFVKDFILLGAYLGFLMDRRRGGDLKAHGLPAIKFVFLTGVLFGVLEVLNPSSPSVLIGLFGLKAYFLYIPVAFVLPFAFESADKFKRMIWGYLLLAIPVEVLGFFQMVAPDSILSTYVSNTEESAVLSNFGEQNEFVRTSGTFSYISGYAAYLNFIAFLALAYNFSQKWRIKKNIVPMAALVLSVGAMFTTGSRAPVYSLLIALPIIVWMAAAGDLLDAKMLLRLAILGPVIVVLAISTEAFDAFMARATSAGTDSTLDRLLQPFEQIATAVYDAPLFGIGIGTTHPAALSILGVRWPWWLGDLITEVEPARIAVEVGIIGLVIIGFLRVLVVVFAFRQVWLFKTFEYRALAIPLFTHLLLGMTGSIMLNATLGLYFWGALGLILAMRRLENLEAAAKLKHSFRAAPPKPIFAT